jgi:hypothetical protein
MLTIEEIQRNSEELRRLNARIHATYEARDKSDTLYAEWEEACAQFHRNKDRLAFPGGEAAFEKVRTGDAKAVEAAIRFLVADPYHFRSGYMKQYLWRWLPRLKLSASKRKRLEDAALQYLNRRIGREFWQMVKAMRKLAGTRFWAQVSDATLSTDKAVARRATYVLAGGADIHAAGRVRRAINREVLRRKYGG